MQPKSSTAEGTGEKTGSKWEPALCMSMAEICQHSDVRPSSGGGAV